MLRWLNPQYVGRVVTWLAQARSTKLQNIRNVLIDGLGVGIVMGVASFLSVFLVRLGASPFLVGLLTAMPALTGMVLAIPVGRFLERQPDIVPWYSRARFWVFTSYALTGLVPFVFSDNAALVIILIWAIATLPQTVVSVAFTVVMGGVAGATRRFLVMSSRWSLLGLANALMVAGVGFFLDRVHFPLNYQLAFLASFAGGLISLHFSSNIDLPQREPEAEEPVRADAVGWHGYLALVREYPAFGRLLASQFVFRFGLTMILPLLPLYWVRQLQASDAAIGLINTVQGSVLLVAYFLWVRLVNMRGQRFVLLVTSLGLTLYPFLTALTPSVQLLVLYAGLSGLFMAGTDLILFDVLLATCPEERQATFVGMHQTVQNGAMFLGPLTGTWMAGSIGIVPALLVAAGVRLIAFMLFYLLKVGQEEMCEPVTDSTVSEEQAVQTA
jgi:hypothetical protein